MRVFASHGFLVFICALRVMSALCNALVSAHVCLVAGPSGRRRIVTYQYRVAAEAAHFSVRKGAVCARIPIHQIQPNLTAPMIHLCILPSHKFTHTLFIPLHSCGLSLSNINNSSLKDRLSPSSFANDFLFGFAFRMTPCRVLFFAHILSIPTSKEWRRLFSHIEAFWRGILSFRKGAFQVLLY